MQLIFDSAELMSMSHTLQYFGSSFNYRNQKSISIKGIILENNSSGVAPVWESMSGMVAGAHDYSEVFINGVSFGSGILQSINFAGGNDVRSKSYDASILINETGNLFNVGSGYYSGLTGLFAERLDLVESFAENFDFQVEDNGNYNYQRDLRLKVISGANTESQGVAKSIANIIFSGSLNMPFVNAAYPSFYLASGKKYHKETYDLTNGEFNFSENFKFQDSDNYIWNYSHSAEFQDGSSSVSEKGLFIGADTDFYDTANAAYKSNIAGAFSRCNEVYHVYIGTGCNLINYPAEQRISTNIFEGSIDYEITYSDNKENITGCIWSNSINIDKSKDGIYIVSENGSVKGQGQKTYNPNNQYTQALSCFSGISVGVYDRLAAAFFTTGIMANCQNGLYLESSNFTDSEYEGSISYDYKYSTDEAFNTEYGIDYKKSTFSDNTPLPIKSNFGILNYKEIVAPTHLGNATLGNFKNSIVVIGTETTETSFQSLLNAAQGMYIYPNYENFLKDAQYSFDPKKRTLNLDLDYNYVKYRGLLDILI